MELGAERLELIEKNRQQLITAYNNGTVDEVMLNDRMQQDPLLINTVFSQTAFNNSANLEALVEFTTDSDYEILFNLLAELRANNQNYFDLNASQLKTLERLATLSTPQGLKAAAILAFIGGTDYVPFTDPLNPVTSSVIQTTNVADNIKIYPNPSNGLINVVLTTAGATQQPITIYNALGEKIYQTQMSNQITVDVSEWNAGIYFIHLTIDGEPAIRKFSVY